MSTIKKYNNSVAQTKTAAANLVNRLHGSPVSKSSIEILVRSGKSLDDILKKINRVKQIKSKAKESWHQKVRNVIETWIRI